MQVLVFLKDYLASSQGYKEKGFIHTITTKTAFFSCKKIEIIKFLHQRIDFLKIAQPFITLFLLFKEFTV